MSTRVDFPNQPSANCPACAGPLTREGLCRRCLLDLAFGGTEEAEAEAESEGAWRLGRVAGYEILSVIGRGGMGTVYRAQQVGAGREVALKMMLARHLPDRIGRERFRSEVRHIAALSHPHVLPLYEVGEHDGIPFFSMRFAPGGSLADRLRQGPLDPRQAAAWLAAIARGVQHAHERGILHRDLKPANILLGEQGEPFVADFGVARALDEGEGVALTLTGVAVGSPGYMAPEQARGSVVTTAADVFGLGAILYECLAGSAPFAAPTPLETMRRAAEEPPRPPRALRAGVPRDLEVIALKCLAKDPKARYRSAGELADDLDLWLAGRPIRARSASAWERTTGWARRKPVVATVAAALLVLFVAGAAGVLLANARLISARDRAVASEKAATERLATVSLQQGRAARRAGRRQEALAALEQARQLGAPLAAVRDETAAALALTGVRPGRVHALIGPGTLNHETDRSLERLAEIGVDRMIRISRLPERTPLGVLPALPTFSQILYGFSPDRRHFAAGCAGGETLVFSLDSGQEVLRVAGPATQGHYALEFSPDGSAVAVGRAGGGIGLFRFVSGARAVPLIELPVEESSGLAFSPDGLQLATVFEAEGWRSEKPGFVRVCRLSDGQVVFQVARPRGFLAVAWSPDGRTIVAACWDGTVVVLDAQTGAERGLLRNAEAYLDLRFSHTGHLLLGTTLDGEVHLWDVRDRQRLATLNSNWARFTPDDRELLLLTPQREAQYFEIDRAVVLRELPAPDFLGRVFSFAASADGDWLASAGITGVRLHHLPTREARQIERPDAEEARLVAAFLPDSSALLATSRVSGLYRHELGRSGGGAAGWQQINSSSSLLHAISADGARALVTNGPDRIGGVPTLIPLRPGGGETVELRDAVPEYGAGLSPDGRWALSTNPQLGGLRIWDLGRVRVDREVFPGQTADGVFSPDSRWLLARTESGYALLDARRDWTPGLTFAPPDGRRMERGGGEFSPDGRLLALGFAPGLVVLYDAHTFRRLVALEAPRPFRSAQLRFARGGRSLALCGDGQHVQVWDLEALQRELTARQLGW